MTSVPSVRPAKSSRRPLRGTARGEYLFLAACWLGASAVLMLIGQFRLLISTDRVLGYREGDRIGENYDLTEDLTFTDDRATAKLIALNRSLANPVYVVSAAISRSVLERYDRFAALFPAALTDSAAAAALRSEFPGAAGLIDWEGLRDGENIDRLSGIVRDALMDVQYAGIFHFDLQDSPGASGIIEAVYSEAPPGRRITLARDSVTRGENLPERIRGLESLEDLSPPDREFAAALAVYFSEANGYLDDELTEGNMREAEEATPPVTISLDSGTRLLNTGGIVSARQARIINELRKQRNLGIHRILDPPLFIAFIFAAGIAAARTFRIRLTGSKTRCLYIILAGMYIVTAGVLVHISSAVNLGVVLPTALFTLVLAQLLQDRRMALLSSFLTAAFVYFLTSGGSHDFIITFTAGVGGTLAVKRRETRMGLLRAGPRLALLLFSVTMLSGFLARLPLESILLPALIAGINGIITGILSLAFLPLLEHLLNTATTFRLIELSDQNVPVLKRMRLQAPGTYIHSQNVAHMAEAACEAIGADGLLARVGAYYHDIGKVDQPHFFVENQSGENKHDEMKATLSVAVIKSHVKIGMEKGRELRLPDEVLAIIEQHHGTSIIRYFYDRALKEKGADAVRPGDFSYDGPKPESREAAVVMLADLTEAAVRTLKKPSASKLDKYVRDLITDRFKTGELSRTSLTSRDLEKVKDSFVQVLTGYFHSRIEYPE